MNEAQGAAGTGEAERATQTTQAEPGPKKELSPLQMEVRKQLGIPVADAEKEPKETPAEQPETAEPEKTPEEEEEQQPAEGPQETVPEPAAAEEEKVSGDWPPEAKARIAEESRKRRERTQERDQWKATAENLQQQLSSRQLATPNPASEVLDQESLKAEQDWEEIRAFTRANPDGAEDVLLGQDAKGNEQRHDYTREEIIKMGMDADRALSALAAKRALLEKERDERVKARTAEAQSVYPDLFRDTEAGREAHAIVQRFPGILQSEEWALALGDYMAGRKLRLARHGKNGKPLSKEAQAIMGAPKLTPAPGVIKSRSPGTGLGAGPGRGGSSVGRVDTKQADEEFWAAGGTQEALEARIKRKLAASEASRSGPTQSALM